MENQQLKSPRKRVVNFTADEKALLADLIQKMPIVESKRTDAKSVAKKQVAWDVITREFNSNDNVHKRETITLKRAWDNMKAYTRKACATEKGNSFSQTASHQLSQPNEENGDIEDFQNSADESCEKYIPAIEIREQVRRPTDYVRREAVLRIRHLKSKKTMEMQLLQTQLEVEEIKKKTALLEEETRKVLLEKAKIELEELKKQRNRES